jgi:phenylalanyl-tRNA synthetase beta chain
VRILRSWLDEFGPISRAARTPERLAEAMTGLGLAVESMTRVGLPVPGVVVARVARSERHPKADKVQRVWVDAGAGERHVWCGAFNMAAGDLVPLATLGTTMPDGREISRREILGIASEGMLCSAAELGLGADGGGIAILPPGLRLGRDVFAALRIAPEVVFDLDVTRNRPDATSHLGVARDLAALLRVRFSPPPGDRVRRGPRRAVPVWILEGRRCARLVAVEMSGVRVGPSPAHLQRRLTHAGMRPINNVVDATNLAMLETNQPTHAYDAERLGGGLRVRLAREGEQLATLDGTTRACTADDLLICDGADTPVGLAGVMGGRDSEISAHTTRIVLEAAWFAPAGVRRTSQRHALRSEASARFERGVDPRGGAHAAMRVAAILRESCPGLVVHAGATDRRTPHLPRARRTTLRVAQVGRVLGTPMRAGDVRATLGRIGFVARGSGARLSVTIPSWRPDCTEEIDLIEELARHHGYGRLGRVVPPAARAGGLSEVQQRRRALRRAVLGLGATEVMPHPFLDPAEHARAGVPDSEALRLANPLVAEESVLRVSLLPGLLRTIASNQSYGASDVAVFELGHVYPRGTGEGPLPDEREHLCVAWAGRDAAAATAWWVELSAVLGTGAQVDQRRVPAGYHPTRSATLARGPRVLGRVGEVDPAVLARYGIQGRVASLELEAGVLLAETPRTARSMPVSRYPASDFDMAFVVPAHVTAEALRTALHTAAGALAEEVSLFDVYRRAGERSLAYRVRLRSPERTLTDADVATARTACIGAAGRLGATLRA